MIIKTFTFNPFQENTYLLIDKDTSQCVVIDSGCLDVYERSDLKNFITSHNLSLKYILNTHLHLDHIFGMSFLQQEFHAAALANKKDEFMLQALPISAQLFGIEWKEGIPSLQQYISDGDVIKFGNSELLVIETPGHSPGGVCFYSKSENCVFAGDTLFNGSIGRTDLEGGNFDTLITSIIEKLFSLPNDTVVFCGHGSQTTIGHERKTNPFLI